MSSSLRSIAPAQAPEAIRSSASRSTRSSNVASSGLETAGLRPSSFWAQDGMETFLDWLTSPHNAARLQKKNQMPGQRQGDLHKEICRLVNDKHQTSWTEAQVKAKIMYTKAKYREAAALGSSGEGPVLRKQEEICPLFVRLQTVFDGNISANHHPPLPRQTRGKRRMIESPDDSEEEGSDLEARDDASDIVFQTETNTRGNHDNALPIDNTHLIKRQKKEGLTSTVLSSAMDRIYEIANQQLKASDQAMAELRARENAVGNRERGLAEKMLRFADEAGKRADDARAWQRKDLAEERAQFREELAAERAEHKQQLKQEREEFRRDKAEFRKQREELVAEIAALKERIRGLEAK